MMSANQDIIIIKATIYAKIAITLATSAKIMLIVFLVIKQQIIDIWMIQVVSPFLDFFRI